MAEVMKPKRGKACSIDGFGKYSPEVAMIVREHVIGWRRLLSFPHSHEKRLHDGVHGHPSPLPSFGFVNREHTNRPVDIRPSQTQEFSLPEARMQRGRHDGMKARG